MNVHQLKIELTIQGPFLTHGLGAKQFGLDTNIARDSDGEPVIPGSLIKGNLLHSINELNLLSKGQFLSKELIDELFGQITKSDYEPERGLLNFDYFWKLKEPLIESDNKTINRIKIDEQLGVVEKGSLQVIESPFLQGESYTFEGSISFYEVDESRVKQLKNAFDKAFQYISNLGALKGIGFGKILNSKISSAVTNVKNTKDHKLKKLNRFAVNLNFDRPVCFSKQTSQENLFISEEHLTGAILKGAIASKIRNNAKFENLQAELANIIIGWFKPSIEKVKPRIIPLSVAFSESDDANTEFINYISDNMSPDIVSHSKVAKTWQSDWKYEVYESFYKKNKDFKTESLIKSLIVRTAINGYQEDNIQLKNTAKDSQLFSYQCIEPKNDVKRAIDWKGTIDISETTNPKAIASELQLLFASPLIGLGKTKAQATVTLTKAPNSINISSNDSQNGSKYISIVLETDTLINLNISKYNPCLNVFQAYKKAFAAIDPNLALVDFCAEQHLQGGNYYWQRYFKNTLNEYQPQVLTNAGSVFVFESNNETKIRIERWLRLGIDPSPKQLGNREDALGNTYENWQVNPFNRGNGYGEISLLPACYMNSKESAHV